LSAALTTRSGRLGRLGRLGRGSAAGGSDLGLPTGLDRSGLLASRRPAAAAAALAAAAAGRAAASAAAAAASAAASALRGRPLCSSRWRRRSAISSSCGGALGLGAASSSRRCSSACSALGPPAFVDPPAGRVVALDEDPLLAHLDLDRARLAAGIGLLDLAGALARQRDLLALGASVPCDCAQVLEQALLVGVGQRVVGRLLGDTPATAAARAAWRPGG
jgi:hypothetical protein